MTTVADGVYKTKQQSEMEGRPWEEKYIMRGKGRREGLGGISEEGDRSTRTIILDGKSSKLIQIGTEASDLVVAVLVRNTITQ